MAKCHKYAFSGSLSSALGIHYLKKMLSWYILTPKTFLIHCENNKGDCIGYCGGMVSDGSLGTGSASGMAQHSFNAAILGFIFRPWLVFHSEVWAKWPLLWKNIKVKLRLRNKIHFNPNQLKKMSREPYIGLVVIGVDPLFQGKGYGWVLLKEFERIAKEEYNIEKLQLSVLADNYKAIKSYERNGWKRGHINGRSLNMFKTLSI